MGTLNTPEAARNTPYCDCPEMRYIDAAGIERDVIVRDRPFARHDCAYTRARSKLVRVAWVFANLHVDRADKSLTKQWCKCFNLKMAELCAPLSGPATLLSAQDTPKGDQ